MREGERGGESERGGGGRVVVMSFASSIRTRTLPLMHSRVKSKESLFSQSAALPPLNQTY